MVDTARQRGILVVVDNTFATPWAQRPLELGADIVIHSANPVPRWSGPDMVGGGVVVVEAEKLAENWGSCKICRAHSGPSLVSFFFEAARGLKALALRMERHVSNAGAIANWLEAHPAVTLVIYAALSYMCNMSPRSGRCAGGGGIVYFFIARRAGCRTQLLLARLQDLCAGRRAWRGREPRSEHPAP